MPSSGRSRPACPESDLLDDELAAYVATTFAAMVRQTPALHAHWLEIQDRLARVAAEQLALQAGIGPADPEPTIAGWALAGLVQVDMDSRVRHIRAGRRGVQLRDAVAGDVRQAAQLLEAGLASLSRGLSRRAQRLGITPSRRCRRTVTPDATCVTAGRVPGVSHRRVPLRFADMRRPVPWIVQYASPSLIAAITYGGHPRAEDPRWRDSGAPDRETYAAWCVRWCGMACFRMALLARDGVAPTLFELATGFHGVRRVHR